MLEKYRSDQLEDNTENNNLAMMGNIDNLLKWFFVGLGSVFLIYGLFRHAFRVFFGRKSKGSTTNKKNKSK